MYQGLACSSQDWILSSLLDATIQSDSGIRKQDGATVITAISQNPLGRYLVWDWLRGNWAEISAYYDPSSIKTIASVIESVTNNFNTVFELNQLQEFYDEHKDDLASAEKATKARILSVKENIAWMETYYNEIESWLIENN